MQEVLEKRSNIHLMGATEGAERDNCAEAILEKITIEIPPPPKLMKNTKEVLQITK